MGIRTEIKRSIVKRAIKRRLIKRATNPLFLIGGCAIAALAFDKLRRKGVLKGAADVALDLIPVVGLTKNVIESFTGEFIPGKK